MTVRPPAVAGTFYPDDPTALRAEVQAHLAAPAPHPAAELRGPLAALVAPHAGYVYSGPVAGVGYRLLPALRGALRAVLLLGPAHYVPVRGLAVTGADLWRTPLGDAPVDSEGRDRLLASAAGTVPARVDDSAHRPEHSLEVQVPFLQQVLPDVPVLPVLVGDVDADAAATALRPWWDDAACLVVVSTDLSHYEPAWSAREHDARTAAAICRADAAAVGDHDACGARPLRVLLRLAAATGARVRQLDLRTSADTAGSPERVVGYGAFAVERAG